MLLFDHRAAPLILCAFLFPCVATEAPSRVPPQTSTPEGLRLLHKMQAALGGADKIAAIRDYEETVRAKIWNNSGVPMGEVRKRTRWMRSPNVLRLDQVGPRDTYVLYFDGTSGSGWEILPDVSGPDSFKTSAKAVELTGGELTFARNYLTGFQLTTWLADRMPSYVLTSPAANVLRIEHEATAEDTTLDPATGLPVKSNGVSLADPDRPTSSEMRIGAWTEVAGVHFPTLRTNYHNGVKLAELTTEEGIHVNTGLLPQVLAAKPADLSPDLPIRK